MNQDSPPSAPRHPTRTGLLADSVAVIAYALPIPLMAEAWLGTLAYAYQIYFDFSGYSDMAIGLPDRSRLVGEEPTN